MICRKCKREAEDVPFCPWCGTKQSVEKKKTKVRGNGTGSVYKRGKTYTVAIARKNPYNGQKETLTKSGFMTSKAAWEYLPTLKNSFDNPQAKIDAIRNPPLSETTLEKMWLSYQETNKYHNLGKNTKSAYKTAWAKLESIHDMDIRLLTIEQLNDIISEKGKTYEPAKDMQSVLSHCYNWAISKQFLSNNIAKLVILPENKPKEGNPFNSDEIDRLWGGFDKGDIMAAYSLLMIYSGMMPGELFKAEKQMIDWKNQVIIGAGMKTNTRRDSPIVLADFILPVLQFIVNNSPNNRICPMSQNRFYPAFKAMLEKYNCRENLTPYSCRHSTATGMALRDIPHSIMLKVMRQKKFSTTLRYIHINEKPSLDAVNALAPKNKRN